MSVRFVTRKLHSRLDYPVAFALIGAPLLLGLGATNPAGLWLGVGTGIAALLLTLLTDHETGVLRVLPYSVHLAVDALVGVVFLVAPTLLGLQGLDAWFYWVNGAAVLSVVTLHKPEVEAPALAEPIPGS